MDLAESGINRPIGLLSRVRGGGFQKVSYCETPLKSQSHLVKLLAIRNIIVNGAEKIHCAVGMEKMWSGL
jgi:hypothetical protein